jgi:multimeric flavodoxin WrbA
VAFFRGREQRVKEQIRVLGIFGSPRKGGNTDLLLEEALKGAEEEGAAIERLRVRDLKITPCIECLSCFKTGQCILKDDMQEIYPKLLRADVIILASPIFFYGITAWAKALVDRAQALWARKYVLKDLPKSSPGKRRKGFLISVGGTKGQKVFEGSILSAKYFFDAVDAEYAGELVFRGIDAKDDILKQPEALQQAHEAGKRLALSIQGVESSSIGSPLSG